MLVGMGSVDSAEQQQSLVGAAPALSSSTVSRKLELLERFTTSEKNLARLAASESEEADEHFRQARAALETATAALNSGELEAATGLIERGYEHMSLALRNAKDPRRQVRLEVQRYEKLRQRVFSFSEAFERIAKEKSDPRVSALLDQKLMGLIVVEAQDLSREGDYAEATDLMQKAAAMLEQALSRARDKETLIQELSFFSPEDEFEYELRRNESYEMLVNLLEGGQTASRRGLRMMDEVLARNAVARSEAQALFSAGDVEGAISVLERSSEKVSRILQMSGLAF